MQRKIAILVTCLLFVSNYWGCIVSANAIGQEQEGKCKQCTIAPFYVNISSVRGYAWADGSNINVQVSVNCKKSVNINIKMQLQKKNNGSWSTVRTWNKSYSNKRIANADGTYLGKKGCTYRMKYTVSAGKDNQTSATPEVKL